MPVITSRELNQVLIGAFSEFETRLGKSEMLGIHVSRKYRGELEIEFSLGDSYSDTGCSKGRSLWDVVAEHARRLGFVAEQNAVLLEAPVLASDEPRPGSEDTL